MDDEECPSCKEYAARGGSFCGECGRPLSDRSDYVPPHMPNAPAPPLGVRNILELILLIACLFVLAIAVFEVIVLVVNSGDVFSFLSDKIYNFIVIVPYPYAIFKLDGFALQIYWILVVMIILSCVATTLQKFIADARSKGITKPGVAENTAAFWVMIALIAMFFINVIVVAITEATGNETTVPDFGSNIEQMFLMADAAVWEEIISRVLYIGVPMAIISLIVHKKKDALKCLLGGFGMSKAALFFIIVSGVIFGLAHYPGWYDQLWKVVTAGMMGIFLGYIFVRFGLYAAILLHFINDYLSAFSWVGADLFLGVILILFLIMGFVPLLYIIIRMWDSGKAIKTLPLFKNGHIKGG